MLKLKNVFVCMTVGLGLMGTVYADGKASYDKYCKKCHGDNGTGKNDKGEWLAVYKTLKMTKEEEKATLNIITDDAKKLTLDQLVTIIKDGKLPTKEKGKMKAIKAKEGETVTDDEIKSIANYTFDLIKKGVVKK